MQKVMFLLDFEHNLKFAIYDLTTGTVDSAYLQSLFVRENFAIKRTLR